MTYTSFQFYIFLPIVLLVYYLVPKTYRWLAILLANFCFIWAACKSPLKMALFCMTILVSYSFGLAIEKKKAKSLLALSIVLSISPLIINRIVSFTVGDINIRLSSSIIIPLGLSFYSMQLIAYLVDVYKGTISAQHDFLKYALFVSFFPQIIQGPIPRYEQLTGQLVEGHDFSERNLIRGIQLMIWGFFLKYMIADKARIVVDTIFDNYTAYTGLYMLIAGVLYSIQLYTDFLGCVTLSQGMAGMLGIQLVDNFRHPYFSESIKDFWRRWHISLSTWLKDYIYIPLGGNRKGKQRKYANLVATFLVSGLWHGGGIKYVFWGLMHGVYQIVEGLVPVLSKKFTGPAHVIRVVVNFFFVMLAWIVFRADTLKIGIKMIIKMFQGFNPWILFDGSLYSLGLVEKEWNVLIFSMFVLFIVSMKQEKGTVLRDVFESYNTFYRWLIYITVIATIWVFGTYGFGFNAADFIYGGF